jgi:serine/threonine protein kinase/endo-1,4-beta-D-glucanase Y
MPSDGKTRFSMPTLAPGVRLNDTYEIDEHIASGGMGEVYRGHNIETGEPVAIKTMLPELARDEAVFALFRKEATLLGRLRHETIVHYYSFSRDPAIGQPYLVMEFVAGQALSDRIAAGALGTREAATLIMRVAEGLAVAHQAGVVHRDLSPDNIILSGGDVRHPRIIDFGIARSLQAGDGTLIGSNFAGKFNFVSPEQLGMGTGEVTNRSDIYSLALVLAAALRGKPLDMGGTHVAVIEKRRSVPDLSGVDAGLLPLIQRMLAPDPADRPADMTEVAEWLRDHLAGRPPTVPPLAAERPRTVPPAAAYESPFGPAPAVATTTPATAASSQPRGSRIALAASIAAVVLIGGAGAAYLAGLFDRQGEETIAASTSSEPRADSAETAPPPVADAEKPGATQAEPQASETAGPSETQTGQPPATQAAEPPAAEPKAADEPVETEAVERRMADEAPPLAAPAAPSPAGDAGKSEAAAETPQAPPAEGPPDAVAVEQPADAPKADAGTPVESEMAASEASRPVGSAAGDQAGGADAVAPAAGTAVPPPVALEGDCFFATIAAAEDDTLAVRGLAPSQAHFDSIARTVTDAGGKPPIIEGPVVSAAQCAVVDFLEAAHPHAKSAARLMLSSTTPRIGGTLTATVTGAGGEPVRLVGIDGDGKVRLLGAASKGDAQGNAAVAVQLDANDFNSETAHLVLALVGDMPLGVPEGAAAAYFPELAAALIASGEAFAMDFAHFRPAAGDAAPSFEPVAYAQGSIRPNHLTQAELDRALVEFYQGWKKLYVVPECGEGRYFVKVNADGKAWDDGTRPRSITSSEAHGYGMLALALMAGADPDAQLAFDGLYHFRADHPAASNRHLMAWSQVEGCATAGDEVGGANTATDGDLDIAYALLVADAQWGGNGRIDYRKAALDMIAAILQHDIAAEGDFPMMGDWAATSDEKKLQTAVRTSDLMLAHFKAFADASGEQRWLTVRDRGYGLIETVTRKFSPKAALMPDFIAEVAKAPKPAPANFMEGENDGDFSWNAARYPWRIGLDYLLHGETRAHDALGGFNKWVRKKVSGDPSAVADTYRLNGSAAPGTGTGSLTFISLMGVSAMIDAENQAWLNAVWNHIAEQKLEEDDFYGNTLKLMAMIAMSGHWTKL